MFIRKKTKKDSKTKREYYTYQLVESTRTEKGPRQHVLLSIGNQIMLSDTERKLLACRIEEIINGVQPLIQYPKDVENLANIFACQLLRKKSTKLSNEKEKVFEPVDLDSITHEHCRTVGLEHISLQFLRKLELDVKLKQLGFTEKQIQLIAGVIIGRLVQPGSERSTHYWLQNLTAFDELIEADFSRLSLSSVYRIADLILAKKDNLEAHLIQKETDLFSFDNAILFYDLTNTYFEGSANNITKAKRGRSKEKQSNSPLITLGLVVNQQGFPIKSHIFEGNVSESKTLQSAVKQLNCSNERKPTIVLDAGIATEENLCWLRENQYSYIVCSRKKKKELPKDCVFETVKETKDCLIKATCVRYNDTNEMELVCHSTTREKKEISMRTSFQKLFEEALQCLLNGLGKKRAIKKYDKIAEKIGRLKEKYSCIAQYYEINVHKDDKSDNATNITWECNTESIQRRFGGVYVLRCYGLTWSSSDLWQTYIMLTKVEEGFCCLKSNLGLRPIFHKTDNRVDAHLFISVLAYHIMQSILYSLQKQNICISWETLRNIMSSYTRVTTCMKNEQGQTIHIRSSTNPESQQRHIYRALNISDIPGRRIKSII
jgi:transposase